jgi:hypothetical protein
LVNNTVVNVSSIDDSSIITDNISSTIIVPTITDIIDSTPHVTTNAQFYECECLATGTLSSPLYGGCYQELKFTMDNYFLILCGVKSYNSYISLYRKNEKMHDLAAQFNHNQIEKLNFHLDQCLFAKAEKIPGVCKMYSETWLKVPKDYSSKVECKYCAPSRELSLCFSGDKVLTGGFVNSTVLNKLEVLYLYRIIRDWAIEEWADISDSDHLISSASIMTPFW